MKLMGLASLVLALLFFGCSQLDKQDAKIERVIDGDTLVAGGKTVRLALIDAPEYNQKGGIEAMYKLEEICEAGSRATIDIDAGQPTDSYGRTVAVVYCSGKNANEEMLKSGLVKIYYVFCAKSEFGNEEWAKRYGC